MFKILQRGKYLELAMMCGIVAESKGLALARDNGIATSSNGIDDILKDDSISIVFDATTAAAHMQHAPALEAAGKVTIDLTPAAVGPYVVPVINLEEHLQAPNVNLITCGGQATIPIVHAISCVAEVDYAEVVVVISRESAGPGTRRSIDEFTQTTAKGIVELGGAKKGKAIILLNPSVPPMIMSNTIYTKVSSYNEAEITRAVLDRVEEVKRYVPGYSLKMPPVFDGERIVTMVDVEGAGDYLPAYSGNLDIETCAALAIGERLAENIVNKGGL
jgi:acetaldehyde dehydrogenase